MRITSNHRAEAPSNNNNMASRYRDEIARKRGGTNEIPY